MKPSRAASMSIVAAILFGVGLIGGLTPSEGEPSLLQWLVFAVVPLGLTLLGFLAVRSWAVRAVLLIEAGVIVAFTVHLLHRCPVLRSRTATGLGLRSASFLFPIILVGFREYSTRLLFFSRE